MNYLIIYCTWNHLTVYNQISSGSFQKYYYQQTFFLIDHTYCIDNLNMTENSQILYENNKKHLQN